MHGIHLVKIGWICAFDVEIRCGGRGYTNAVLPALSIMLKAVRGHHLAISLYAFSWLSSISGKILGLRRRPFSFSAITRMN